MRLPRIGRAAAIVGLAAATLGMAAGQAPAPVKKAAAAPKPAKAAAPAAKKSAFKKDEMETYLRHLFVIGPQFKITVGDPKPSGMAGILELHVLVGDGTNPPQDVMFYVSSDGQKILQGKLFDINSNPFRADLDLLKTEFQPSMGTPGASVVIVVFSDFQCSFCKDEAKMLRKELVAYNDRVRLYFKDFPLEQIHPWAKAAAIAARCVFRQEPARFWDYHDWIFEHQAEITSENLKTKVLEWANSKKMDPLLMTRCLDTRATEAEVDKSIAEGRALQLNSTPTLFVNGRRMVGQVSWPQLKQIIDTEIEYQKTAKNAGEDCGCEVPQPIKIPK